MHTHKPRKRFGQNFLHDQSIIQHIIKSINPLEHDELLEIGPGLGALTRPLLEKHFSFTAIEIDRDIIQSWQNTDAARSGQLRLISGDALKIQLSDIEAHHTPFRIFGNLPYNISTPLLFHFFGQINHIQDMHFMLQKEVVDRLVAKPNSKEYGRISIMTQALCKAECLMLVPAGAFTPPPKVTSAVVRLSPRSEPKCELNQLPLLQEVTAHAFGQRRKMLSNTIGKKYAQPIDWNELGIEPSLRAENLSVDQFILLTRHLHNK